MRTCYKTYLVSVGIVKENYFRFNLLLQICQQDQTNNIHYHTFEDIFKMLRECLLDC